MMSKILNGLGPEALTDLFTYKSEMTNSDSFYLPQPRTDNMKNSFMYHGARLWNSILKKVKKIKSLSYFQKNNHFRLKNDYFYRA